MSIEKKIGDLIDEDLAQETPQQNEKASPLADRIFESYAVSSESQGAPGTIERREFNRAEVAEKKIELRFSTQQQFAKQYIENISVGGLFVRTKEKYAMGTVLPIRFNLPLTDGLQTSFELVGRVCRVTDAGVGLEFTNLTAESRAKIESYVRQSLPKGLDIRTKAKASTIERLEKTREDQKLHTAKRKRHLQMALIFAALIGLNIYFVKESIEELQNHPTGAHTRMIHVEGQSIQRSAIQSMRGTSEGKIFLELHDGNSIEVRNLRQLPYDLRQTAETIRSIPPQEPARRSRNTNSLTNIRP